MRPLLFLLLIATATFAQPTRTIKVRKPKPTVNYILCEFSGNTLTYYYPMISCDLTCNWKGYPSGKKCNMIELTQEINELREGTIFYLDNIKQKMDNGMICTVTSMQAIKSNKFKIILQPMPVPDES